MLPCPLFGVLAETKADLAVAIAVFHNESADEALGRRLKMMLDGDFDPANDFVGDTGDEGGLIVGTRGQRFDPTRDVGG